VESLSDSVLRATPIMPLSAVQEIAKTPQLPNGKLTTRCHGRSLGTSWGPPLGDQQFRFPPGHGENIANGIARQVDAVEAFRQLSGQPYPHTVSDSPAQLFKLEDHRQLW